jgi:hypothetical protein
VDHAGQLVQLARPAQDVHVGEPAEDVVAVALGHAADHADDDGRVEPLAVAQLAEAGPHLLLGVLADAAGVEHDDVGRVAVVGADVPLPAELAEHQLAVQHVHLAAEGFEE